MAIYIVLDAGVEHELILVIEQGRFIAIPVGGNEVAISYIMVCVIIDFCMCKEHNM
ncbi:hypothetical protein [Porphyromonas pogonae]|uniref:hypothetical protein n=1 Tax=Porphyromonas pogonae TaxID=867595 RepID=UPI002E79EC18|nr:hypothetical protein [Porphyromonas pogonae]